MQLTIDQATALATVKLYKASEPISLKVLNGEDVSRKEKDIAVKEVTELTMALLSGQYTDRQIAVLCMEWLVYFKEHMEHADFGQKNLPFIQEIIQTIHAKQMSNNL